MKLFFAVILVCFAVLSVAAQPRNTLRDFKIPAGIREQQLDTLSILQHSFAIFDPYNNPLEKVFYQIDFVKAKIVLTIPEKWKDDSLRVTYEVWPLNFAAPIFIRDASNITPLQPGEDRVAVQVAPSVPGHGLLRFEGLQSSGSISRGLTMGNRQDVTMRSDMNLQMSGMLTENIEILAAISDQDIPFQPDGYTQQIQDFDRVFIQLSTPQTRMIAGDFDMGRPSGNFMNFTRKARGATISHNSETETGFLFGQGQVTTTASAAISRGNYARNVILGIEGNQGPYRLEGNNNESFIMILAGSERVYVDGVRMIRGMQGDYVIDYNMAEITFTASRLITRNSRIVVEFEYAERNFARSVLFSGTEVRYDNAHFWFNFFSEQDHRNQSLFQELTDDRRALMTAAGDSLRQVFDWNVDSTGFQNDRVMYRLTDSLGFDSVFVFSTDPILAVYQPRFAWVGQGNGNYRQIRSAANGKVFQWVEPQNGVPQGTHEPIVLLVTPKSHQMVTAGGKFNIAPTTTLNFEYGFSNQDINLFSNLHENDNRGHAMKIGIADTRGDLGAEEGWRYITRASWETAGHTFRPLERYRGVEFERNWNLLDMAGNDTEHLSEISFAMQHPRHGHLNYTFNALFRGVGYTGIMNEIDSRVNIANNRFEYNGRLLNSGGIRETMFYRHNSLIARDKRLFTIGMGHQMESNKFFLPDSPVLTHGSNSFSEWEVFLSNPVESVNQYRLFYRLREDHIPILQSFESASRSSDIGAKFQYLDNPDQRIGVQIIYRRLNLLREMMPDNNVGRTLNTRVDYTSRWANGAITSNLFYEASSQRTQRREFIYVEVPAGQGVFVWNDYDGNNLMELDEFEIAPFPDEANFVRVFVPTRDFVPVYTNTFSQSLIIDPAVQWRDQYGIRGLLARFSNRFNYRIDNKRMGGLATENFNPFHGNMNDTSLISMNSTLRNSLAFNRTNPVFTIEWIWQSNRNKQLLSNGFESLLSEVHSIRGRWSITRQYSLNLTGTLGDSETNSEFFANRNFRIESKELEPTLSYQHGANLRINIFYGWGTRENLGGGLSERSRQNKTGIEIRFSMPARGNIQARYELAKIEFPHPENTPVAFKILQGLRAGANHAWNINWQHNLNRFLQISLIYNGRLPTGLDAIHTGTVQVRALF